MFKQKNQPCFTIHLAQKFFAYFFQKSVVPTFCLSRRIDFNLAIRLAQKFFAYFFTKKANGQPTDACPYNPLRHGKAVPPLPE